MLAQCQPPVTSSGFFVNSSNMIDIPDSYAAAAAAAVANQSQYPMHFQSKPRMTSLPAGTSSTSRPSNPAMTSAPPTLSSVPSSRIQVKKQRRNVSLNVTPESRNLSSCGKGSSDFGQRTAQACDRCKQRKMKCDSDPVCCANCKAVGRTCLQIDRVTMKQYPRGEIERVYQRNGALERQLQAMQLQLESYLQENDKMRQQIRQLSHSQGHPQGHRQGQVPSLSDSKSALSSQKRSQSLNVSAMGTSAAVPFNGNMSSMNATNNFFATDGVSYSSYPPFGSNFHGISEEPVAASQSIPEMQDMSQQPPPPPQHEQQQTRQQHHETSSASSCGIPSIPPYPHDTNPPKYYFDDPNNVLGVSLPMPPPPDYGTLSPPLSPQRQPVFSSGSYTVGPGAASQHIAAPCTTSSPY